MEEWQKSLREAEQLYDQKELDEAERLARAVLELQPQSGRAWQVLGLILSERKQMASAIPMLQKAVGLQPDLVPAHNGLGLCYFQVDRLDEALDHLNRALILDPTHANAHFNRGAVLLKLGQYSQGWLEYEWRWVNKSVAKTNVPVPKWDGSPLEGRRLMVLTEQGIGDVLQFVRMLPLVKHRGGRIVFACQKALQPFLACLPDVDDWFPIDTAAPIHFDLQIPLLSLPAIFGLDAASIPRQVPYVFPQAERIQKWKSRIEAISGKLRVGIYWQGNPTFSMDYNRSLPLKHFLALKEIPELALVSLQKGHGEKQIPDHREDLKLTVFEDRDADGTFIDTAGMLAHLDLVITSDSSIAHLVGALGQPVWLLLGTGADWRWGLDTETCDWYPTMRLFRQKTEGDWPGVLAEVAAELRRVIAGQSKLPEGVDLNTFAVAEKPRPVSASNYAHPEPRMPAQDSKSDIVPLTTEPEPIPYGELTSIHTSNFPDLLRRLNISLVVSTYQAGRLIFLRPEGNTLNTHFRTFDRPMGIAYQSPPEIPFARIAVGCGLQIWEFFDVPLVAPKIPPAGTHDACFLPRQSHYTGDIDVHEMSYAPDGTLWFINTRFCCICTLDRNSSFVPRWKPRFITELRPEDRCHLNGLSLIDGIPRYATALGTADTVEGWRKNKAHGGVLIDISTNEFILEGLSMPHSPRWYRGKLWVLESGDGSIGWVDIAAKKYHKVCELPGFTRGIDFVGPLAFIGLSQVRESAIFSGIPLGNRLKEKIAGVYVVNIETGEIAAFLQFTSGVHEVFAVQVMPGMLHPELINEANDWLKHSYVLPQEYVN